MVCGRVDIGFQCIIEARDMEHAEEVRESIELRSDFPSLSGFLAIADKTFTLIEPEFITDDCYPDVRDIEEWNTDATV